MRLRLPLTIVIASLVFSACGSATVAVPDKGEQIQQYTSTIRGSKEVVDPVHGKETGFWYGAMAGTAGTNANGVAFIHSYADGYSVVTVNLNILLAPAGEHYQAFLSDGKDAKPVDLGTLRSIVGDVRHNLQFESKSDLGDLKTITVKLGEKPVAVGTVKVPSAPIK